MRFQLDPLSASGISIAPELTKATNRGGYAGSPDITRVLQPGTNVTFSGNGTQQSPYVVNATGGGGSGSPGGSDTQLQYNSAGSFAGLANLTTNGTDLTIGDGANINTGTTTGTKIGTATTQKIGFFGHAPVAQQSNTTDIGTDLSNLGLRAVGANWTASTSGAVSFSGTVKLTGSSTSGYVFTATDTAGTGTWQAATALLSSGATQTSNFTATINTAYQVDATSGSITATLPSSSGSTAQIAIKKSDSSTNTVILSGTINGTPASTLTLRLSAQGKVLIADGSGGWNTFSGDNALTQLDARYLAPLVQTATKTSGYTAAGQDLVVADATSGAFAVTLPTAPADKTLIEIKKIDSSTNAITITCGGSDTFIIGGTTLVLSLLGHAATVMYNASLTKWTTISNDLPLVQTDARYLKVSNNLSDVTASTARTNLGLGTVSLLNSIDLTANVTGTLPVANGGTGITSLGTGVATFLGTPTSANLAAALTDETGTGAAVFATNPTLGGVTITDATNLVVGSTTGTQIATATSQKLGFFGMTPVTQRANTTDLGTVLSNLGLRAVGSNYGISTTGTIALTGNTIGLGSSTATVTLTGKLASPAGGAGAQVGTGTLSSGTVTISTTAVTASSLVFLTDTANGANIGILSVGTKTAGTSFVVNSSNVLDAGTFNWFIIN